MILEWKDETHGRAVVPSAQVDISEACRRLGWQNGITWGTRQLEEVLRGHVERKRLRLIATQPDFDAWKETEEARQAHMLYGMNWPALGAQGFGAFNFGPRPTVGGLVAFLGVEQVLVLFPSGCWHTGRDASTGTCLACGVSHPDWRA